MTSNTVVRVCGVGGDLQADLQAALLPILSRIKRTRDCQGANVLQEA